MMQPILGPDDNSREKNENGTIDTTFSREVLRIIEKYLSSFARDKPAKALEYFVGHIQPGGNPSENEKLKNIGHTSVRLTFIKEIRMLVLTFINSKQMAEQAARNQTANLGSQAGTLKTDQSVLLKYHLFVHLIELFVRDDISYYEKINCFLNTNFKLDDDDFIGHAMRGNFAEMKKIKNEYCKVIDEFANLRIVQARRASQQVCDELVQVSNTDGYIDELKAFHESIKNEPKIDKTFYRLITGGIINYNDSLEYLCYMIIYKGYVDSSFMAHLLSSNVYLRILNGDVSELVDDDMLRLITMLALCYSAPLASYEKCFESIFEQLKERNPEVALGYLAFTSNCDFNFNLLVSCTDLTDQITDIFMRFTSQNGICADLLVEKYLKQLEETGKYEKYCRFIVFNSIVGVEYSSQVVLYFIKNYDKFRSLIDETFLTDERNRFIHYISLIKECDYKTIEFLVNHEYAELAIDSIAGGVLDNKNADVQLAHRCLGRIIVLDNKNGTNHKEAKLRLMERILGG